MHRTILLYWIEQHNHCIRSLLAQTTRIIKTMRSFWSLHTHTHTNWLTEHDKGRRASVKWNSLSQMFIDRIKASRKCLAMDVCRIPLGGKRQASSQSSRWWARESDIQLKEEVWHKESPPSAPDWRRERKEKTHFLSLEISVTKV